MGEKAGQYSQGGLNGMGSGMEAYRLLMLCYLERGNRSMALRAYERCEAALGSEMGVNPSRDTAAVLERVRLSTN